MEPREELNYIGKHVESKGKKQRQDGTLDLKGLVEEWLVKKAHSFSK